MLVVALATVFATAFIVGIVFDMVDRDSGLAELGPGGRRLGQPQRHGVVDERARRAHRPRWDRRTWRCSSSPSRPATIARHRNANVVLFLCRVLLGVVLINNGLKLIVDRERPDVPHLVGTSGSSFPSGHSAAAAAAWFAVALVVARHWSRRRPGRRPRPSPPSIAVAVAASRALLGVHWLTDVVAGVVVGWGWFLLCALAFGGRLQRLGEPAERAAVELAHGRRYSADSRRPPVPAATVSRAAVVVRLAPVRAPSGRRAHRARRGTCGWRRTDRPRRPSCGPVGPAATARRSARPARSPNQRQAEP